jgi:hypothetical protein
MVSKTEHRRTGAVKSARSRSIKTGIVALAVSLIGAAAAASGAYADYTGSECDKTYNGTSYCLVPESSGSLAAGDALFVEPQANPYTWIESRPRFVTSAGPFNTPKWDQQFLGEPVLQFAATSDPALCLADVSRAIELESCAQQHREYFVEDSRRLINVAATDAEGKVYELSQAPNWSLDGPALDAPNGSLDSTKQHWCLNQPGATCVGY